MIRPIAIALALAAVATATLLGHAMRSEATTLAPQAIDGCASHLEVRDPPPTAFMPRDPFMQRGVTATVPLALIVVVVQCTPQREPPEPRFDPSSR